METRAWLDSLIKNSLYSGPSGVVNSESSHPQSPTLPPAQPPIAVKEREVPREVPSTPQTPQNHQMPSNLVQQQQQTPDMNTPQVQIWSGYDQLEQLSFCQGPKTKGALKGWSNLRLGDTPATPSLGTPLSGTPASHQKSRIADTTSTFAAYQKAAKEKADRSVFIGLKLKSLQNSCV